MDAWFAEVGLARSYAPCRERMPDSTKKGGFLTAVSKFILGEKESIKLDINMGELLQCVRGTTMRVRMFS